MIIIPYEYVDSLDKLNDTKLLPPEKFYSSLSEKGVTLDEYAHAQRVWAEFDLSTLGEYHAVNTKERTVLGSTATIDGHGKFIREPDK
jgi:hypothetical protein